MQMKLQQTTPPDQSWWVSIHKKAPEVHHTNTNTKVGENEKHDNDKEIKDQKTKSNSQYWPHPRHKP